MTTATPLDRARARAAFLRDRYHRVRRHPLTVHARLAALEEEVQEQRQLNRRIAELTDVVAELLVPIHDRDPDRVEEVLAAYRRGL
ncbi:MAG: DUF6752 domain-containing protein [Blastococcus sp.]